MNRDHDGASRVDAMIQEVLDGTATEATRTRVLRLRAEDPRVAARFDELQRTFSRLDELEDLPLPRRVEVRTSGRPRVRRRARRFVLPIAGAIAAALVAVLVLAPDMADDLGSAARGTLIAGGSDARSVAWETEGLEIGVRPGPAPASLRVTLRDDVGDRPVRLAVDTPGWAIDGVQAVEGSAPGSGGEALVWQTSPGQVLSTNLTLSHVGGAPDALRIRLEVDGTSTVRTIPPDFLNESTNSGATGRY